MKYSISNIIICLIITGISIFIGYNIYHSYNNYEEINYEDFKNLLTNGQIISVEIQKDKIFVVTKLESINILTKEKDINYKILPLSEKDKVLELIKDKPALLISRQIYSSPKNYLFIIPYIILFIAIFAILIGSRRGNIKETLFREKKFNINSPIQKARLTSTTWENIMSGEPFKISNSYEDLPYSEQDNYLLLLMEAIKSEDIEVRRNSSFALREIGDKRTVIPLSKMLIEDNDPHVRMNSALTLGILGDEKAIKNLTKATEDENPLVRCAVATSLGNIGDEGSLKVLEKMLRCDENWRARRSAVIGIMKLRNEHALYSLIEALYDDESVVRSSAAIALGEMGFEEAMDELIKLLLEDPEPAVRRDVIGAIQTIGGDAIIEPLCTSLLKDENVQVRQSAIAALELIENKKARETLITALKNDTDPYVRMAAAEALEGQENNSPEVMEEIKKVLESDI